VIVTECNCNSKANKSNRPIQNLLLVTSNPTRNNIFLLSKSFTCSEMGRRSVGWSVEYITAGPRQHSHSWFRAPRDSDSGNRASLL
jgi:hypothetical protein